MNAGIALFPAVERHFRHRTHHACTSRGCIRHASRTRASRPVECRRQPLATAQPGMNAAIAIRPPEPPKAPSRHRRAPRATIRATRPTRPGCVARDDRKRRKPCAWNRCARRVRHARAKSIAASTRCIRRFACRCVRTRTRADRRARRIRLVKRATLESAMRSPVAPHARLGKAGEAAGLRATAAPRDRWAGCGAVAAAGAFSARRSRSARRRHPDRATRPAPRRGCPA